MPFESLNILQAIETKLKTYREHGPAMPPRQWQQTPSCCAATQYSLNNTEIEIDNFDVNNVNEDETGDDILQQATTNLIAAATIAPLTTI